MQVHVIVISYVKPYGLTQLITISHTCTLVVQAER